MSQLAEQEDYAIVISTHELELALRCANRLWLYDGLRVLEGAPGDLILSGDFARIFAADGVRFDPAAGRFELRRRPTRFVRLRGEGVRAVGTLRALERVGIGVAHDAATEVIFEGQAWCVEGRSHPTVAALLTHLASVLGEPRTIPVGGTW